MSNYQAMLGIFWGCRILWITSTVTGDLLGAALIPGQVKASILHELSFLQLCSLSRMACGEASAGAQDINPGSGGGDFVHSQREIYFPDWRGGLEKLIRSTVLENCF